MFGPPALGGWAFLNWVINMRLNYFLIGFLTYDVGLMWAGKLPDDNMVVSVVLLIAFVVVASLREGLFYFKREIDAANPKRD